MLSHGNTTNHALSVNIPCSRKLSLKPTWPDSCSQLGMPFVTSTSLTTTQT